WIDQVTVAAVPPGSRSLIAAPCETPGAAVANVTVKPIWSPAFTGARWSGVLVNVNGAWRHASDACASPEPSLVEVKVASLLYTPQLAAEVVAITRTVIEAPAARSCGPHANTCDPAAPVNVQAGEAPDCDWIDQVTVPTVPPGSRSLIAAPCETPGPALVNVTVNPIWSPAFTGAR